MSGMGRAVELLDQLNASTWSDLPAGLIGVDIPMGTSAVSLRPQAEVGFLGRGFLQRLTLGAAFGFP